MSTNSNRDCKALPLQISMIVLIREETRDGGYFYQSWNSWRISDTAPTRCRIFIAWIIGNLIQGHSLYLFTLFLFLFLLRYRRGWHLAIPMTTLSILKSGINSHTSSLLLSIPLVITIFLSLFQGQRTLSPWLVYIGAFFCPSLSFILLRPLHHRQKFTPSDALTSSPRPGAISLISAS